MSAPADPSAVADRNLLFGVLCLQADLLDEANFAEACGLWAARKTVPLADLLIERGWISAEDRAHIDFLLARKLRKHQGDAARSLAEAAGADVRDVLRRVEDPDVRRTVTHLPPAPGYVLLSTTAEPLQQRLRYTLTRLHGEGGLGRVYVAHDNDLNRDVALKEIRPDRAQSPDAWHRFLKEAQLTGQLEHPNIVPVYEVARREDDAPFYTMRLVRGQTLREAVAAYHQRRKEGREDPLDRPKLLNAFVSVCQAVGYAHSRGVIHRDLKPDNVMLGGFGEVVVLDWGLAKMIDQHEEGELGVALTEQAQTEATMAGRVLGTPAYAAPEQAEGRIDLIDTRTDIYGLGAILFEILTGQPPHSGEDTAGLLRKVIHGETPRARAVDPSVPAALDAVCAKAMARARADRYAKASDLAQEVQRFLADEPVAAYREPVLKRAGRWGRRHRSLVTSAAVLLIASVAFLAVLAFLIEGARLRAEREWARAEAERQRAEAERERADRNFRQARKAVDDYFTTVSENKLLGLPHLEPLRRELLEKARRYYQQFADEAADDPKVRADHATAVFRVATLAELIGTKEDSRIHYQKAVDLYEAVLAEHQGGDVLSRSRLGTCYSDFGLSEMESGHMAEASSLLERSRAVLEQLVEEDPKVIKHRGALAKAYLNTALWHYKVGAVAQSATFYEKSLALQEQIVREAPSLSEYQADLALTIMNLGSLHLENGRPAQALVLYEQTKAMQEKLVRNHKDAIYYRRLLGAVQHNIGMLHRLMSRPEQAVSAYEEARKIRARLAEEHPAVNDYQTDLGETLNNIGEIQLALRQPEAQTTLTQARDVFRQVSKDNPGSAKARNALALGHNNLGVVLHQADRWDEALEHHQEALMLRQGLVHDAPEVTDYQSHLADTYSNMGNTLRAQGKKDEARRCYETSCALYQKVLAANPTTTKYRTNLALALTNLGYLEDEDDRLEEALAALEKGRAIRQELVDATGAVSDTYSAAQAVLAARPGPDLPFLALARGPLDPFRVPRFEADLAQSHFYIGKVQTRMRFPRYRGPFGAALAGSTAGVLHTLPALYLPLEEPEKGFSPEALAAYHKALATQMTLAASCPGFVDYRADLGRTYIQIGNLYHDDKKFIEAFGWYKKATALWKEVVAQKPHVAEYRSNYGVSLYNFGITLQDMRLALAALSTHEQSRPIREQLVKEKPDNKEYRRELAETYNSLGIATLSLRRRDQSREWFLKAREGFQALVDRYPEDAKFRSDLARAILNQGITLNEGGNPCEALAFYEVALPMQRQAMDMKPGKYRFRELVDKTYQQQAKAYRALDRPAEAAEATLQRCRLWSVDADPLVSAASDLALCIPLVGKGKEQLSQEEQAERERYAGQVMEVLRQAFARGFEDRARLAMDPNLAPLRGRMDFQQLRPAE